MSGIDRSLTFYATGLIGIGGAFALAKGIKDLINPKIINKRIAKAEVVAGSIALLYTALKIVSYADDFSFFPDKRTIIIDEDDFNKKLLNSNNSYIQTAINSIFAGAIIPSIFCGCTCSFACCELLLRRF